MLLVTDQLSAHHLSVACRNVKRSSPFVDCRSQLTANCDYSAGYSTAYPVAS